MGAFWIALGIFLSRILGFVRQRIFAHYFGNSLAGDAFQAAFKIPNFLQNLFGEGVLSASLIPVYSKMLSENNEDSARKLAGAIGALLAFASSILVLIGVLTAHIWVDLLAPGFVGYKRELTISIVRILFPGAGILVFSALCLGVLNSHKKFFLSYIAPVAWNIAMIIAMLVFGFSQNETDLSITIAYASIIGSLLQFLVQIPVARKFIALPNKNFLSDIYVKKVIANFIPVFFGRGVVQISSYIDSVLSSLLPNGGVSAIAYAQLIYTLPVSLFGMSISAAALPDMASISGNVQQISSILREKLISNGIQILYFVIPSMTGFIIIGDMIVAFLYQSGKFSYDDSFYVWSILAVAALSLPANTLGRLYASTFYAIQDTKTPLRYALIRVLISTVFGYLMVTKMHEWIGFDHKWSAIALVGASGISGWIEFVLIEKALSKKIGRFYLDFGNIKLIIVSALLSGAIASLTRFFISSNYPLLRGAFGLGIFSMSYGLVSLYFKIPQAIRIWNRIYKKISSKLKRSG